MTTWNPDDYERYRDEQGRERARPKPGVSERCDFCTDPDPAWEYPAAPMEIVGAALATSSDDEWAACDGCSGLIEAKRIGPLVERMVQGQRANVPPGYRVPPTPTHRKLSRRNVLRFFDARTGPRRPIRHEED